MHSFSFRASIERQAMAGPQARCQISSRLGCLILSVICPMSKGCAQRCAGVLGHRGQQCLGPVALPMACYQMIEIGRILWLQTRCGLGHLSWFQLRPCDGFFLGEGGRWSSKKRTMTSICLLRPGCSSLSNLDEHSISQNQKEVNHEAVLFAGHHSTLLSLADEHLLQINCQQHDHSYCRKSQIDEIVLTA